MNVFVTGGAGYIGSVCVEELIGAGHRVTVYDNLTEGHRSAADTRAVFVPGELSDETKLAQALREAGAEVILHFAANALVGESMTNPGKYFRNNVASGLNLLEAGVAVGGRKVVFNSTSAGWRAPECVALAEGRPARPVNPYGETKSVVVKMFHG